MPPAQATAGRSHPGGGAQTAPKGGQGRGTSNSGGATTFKLPRPQQAAAKRARGRDGEADEVREAGNDEHDGDSNDGIRRRRQGRGGEYDDSDEDSQEKEDDAAGDDEEDAVSIPPELLTRILHYFFQKPNTRMTSDANTAMRRYMEIFVREAVARSMAERRGGGFLDVGVLQKVAAQLIMDM